MSIRRCAYLSLLPILIFNFSFIPLAWGREAAILKVILNGEEKGEFIVNITDDGDFLVRAGDLKKMGLVEMKGKISVIDSEEFVSLKSMEGVKTEFDEKRLALGLTVDPRLLGKSVFELRYPRQVKVYYPKDVSGFLNYNLTAYAGNSFTYDRTVLTNQLGFRVGDFLLLSDSSYTDRKDEKDQFVRLMSNITYDRRQDLERIIFGDFFGTSGAFGNTVNMGGISFSKSYNIDPYFIKYPEIGFSGLAPLASEVEVYRNGVLIKREKVAPGGFLLKDIPTYVGTGLVEVVLRDPFGREQRINLPYYFSDTLLKKGLHDYSYNIGFLREDFGTSSNHYKDLSFLGFHRYGLSDSLTAGLKAEASGKLINLGVSSTLLIPWRIGIVDASVSWSNSKGGRSGAAGAISYVYQSGDLSVNLLLRSLSKEYSDLSLGTASERTKYEYSVGASYFSDLLGSFSAGYSEAIKYIGINTKNLLASYSRKITDRSNIVAAFKRDIENSTTEFGVTFNYYFKKEITASAIYEKKPDATKERVQVMKNLPLGEGFGGRAFLERSQTEGDRDTFYNYDVQLQYNARYGEYGTEFTRTDKTESYSLSAAGAITFVGDSINFTRPVQDSFAVVKVGELKDVRVNLNNQEMGRTNASGKLLIPNLGSYYENPISVNDKDIPIEYTISEVVRYVSPPLRSGSYIEFAATKIQSFIGTLKARVGQEIKPLEYIEFKLLIEGKELLSPTGKGGEFYLENIKPGKYRGEFKYLEKTYAFDLSIPKSEEIIVDLGEIICE
jgi:outer membrane usher protein